MLQHKAVITFCLFWLHCIALLWIAIVWCCCQHAIFLSFRLVFVVIVSKMCIVSSSVASPNTVIFFSFSQKVLFNQSIDCLYTKSHLHYWCFFFRFAFIILIYLIVYLFLYIFPYLFNMYFCSFGYLNVDRAKRNSHNVKKKKRFCWLR